MVSVHSTQKWRSSQRDSESVPETQKGPPNLWARDTHVLYKYKLLPDGASDVEALIRVLAILRWNCSQSRRSLRQDHTLAVENVFGNHEKRMFDQYASACGRAWCVTVSRCQMKLRPLHALVYEM